MCFPFLKKYLKNLRNIGNKKQKSSIVWVTGLPYGYSPLALLPVALLKEAQRSARA